MSATVDPQVLELKWKYDGIGDEDCFLNLERLEICAVVSPRSI